MNALRLSAARLPIARSTARGMASNITPEHARKTGMTIGVATVLATIGGLSWSMVASSQRKKIDAFYKKYDATSPNE
eukprot:g2171.t1